MRWCVALDRRQTARSAAFIGNVILTVDSQRKSRIVIEEKGGHMVIKDVHQRIRFFLLQPALQRFEALEDRRPRRVLLFMELAALSSPLEHR